MKKFIMVSLLLALSRGVFCMNADAAQVYLPAVNSALSRGTVDLSVIKSKYEDNMKHIMSSVGANLVSPRFEWGKEIAFDRAPKNSIALIPLTGAVMKQDYCGTMGTRTIVSLLNKVNENPNFIGSILYIDSPGGEALGTAEASLDIRSASKIKPIVSYVDNMMCSAAIWLGTSANHVIANSKDFTIIGSIGTYITLVLDNPNGPKVKEIYADASTDKNGAFREAKNGNEQPLKDEILNPLNKSFIAAMTRNRYGKILNKEAVFSGKTFQANKALKEGLIDQIGTINDAVAKVHELAKA